MWMWGLDCEWAACWIDLISTDADPLKYVKTGPRTDPKNPLWDILNNNI